MDSRRAMAPGRRGRVGEPVYRSPRASGGVPPWQRSQGARGEAGGKPDAFDSIPGGSVSCARAGLDLWCDAAGRRRRLRVPLCPFEREAHPSLRRRSPQGHEECLRVQRGVGVIAGERTTFPDGTLIVKESTREGESFAWLTARAGRGSGTSTHATSRARTSATSLPGSPCARAATSRRRGPTGFSRPTRESRRRFRPFAR